MKKPIKSIYHLNPGELKVGDEVFFGGAVSDGDRCPLCEHGAGGKTIEGVFVMDDHLCEFHFISQLVFELGATKSLRIEMWRDGSNAWRVGLDWFGEDDFAYLCEDTSLLSALKMARDFLYRPSEIAIKNDIETA